MEISDSDDSVTKEVSQEPHVVTETERLLDDGGDSSARYLTAMNATATFTQGRTYAPHRTAAILVSLRTGETEALIGPPFCRPVRVEAGQLWK